MQLCIHNATPACRIVCMDMCVAWEIGRRRWDSTCTTGIALHHICLRFFQATHHTSILQQTTNPDPVYALLYCDNVTALHTMRAATFFSLICFFVIYYFLPI